MNTGTLPDVKTIANLAGVRIAVTHADVQAEDQIALFQALSATVYTYPCVDIIPFEQTDELDLALQEAAQGKYDWLVLNDADTSLVVADRVKALGLQSAKFPRSLKIATIGCMTEAYTASLMGLRADFAPDVYSPEYVIEHLHLKAGDRVLLPQSAMTRINLAHHLHNTGADVTAINAYSTAIGRGGDPVPALLWEGKVDAITFTFPTAVRYFVRRLKAEGGSLAMLDDVIVACIGPITASAVRDYGLDVDIVPQQHTIQGLVLAIVERFSGRS